MVGLWLAFGFAVSKSTAAALWAAITAPFRPKGSTTTYKHIANAFARTILETASIEQIQYMLPPGSARDAYEALMHTQNLDPNILHLDDGTEAFWLGSPNAEKLIIYFPGGAYFIPAQSAHFELVSALIEDLKRSDQEIGVLFLNYDLAPHCQWPRQLIQGVALIKYAIEVLGKRPSNIVLQGDSAGAHLALAVLSHLAGNHPCISVPKLSLSESLRGILLLSPWIDFNTDHESFRTNADKDTVPAKCIDRWAQAVFGSSEMDRYSHPISAPIGWWGLLPVERIFVGAGQDEIFLDSIISLACKMEDEHSDVLISRVHREFHAEPITDLALKLPPGMQFHAMSAWLNETLSRVSQGL